jgi:Reverse transcriptase (RNA-dependent DNA polymerase)
MESVIKDSIMDHLLEANLIKHSQHGFMPGRSCATNLLTFQDKVTKCIDTGTPVDIFYLDFAKAFDKVPHGRLIVKLEAKGIGGEVKKWIEEWLSERTQCVAIGGKKSGKCAVKSGAPQGTVMARHYSQFLLMT